jgi:hypothetical protein
MVIGGSVFCFSGDGDGDSGGSFSISDGGGGVHTRSCFGFYFSVQCVVVRVLPVLHVLFLAGYMGAFLSPLLFRGAFFLRWFVEQLLWFMS